MHNPSRYTVVCTDGPTICFEYAQAMHLAEGLDMVDEVRPCISWFYFAAGPRLEERAAKWADEIADLVRKHGGGNMRLAVDKMEPLGVDLLRARGITIVEGQEITETARMIKSADELELMDWTIKVCEAGMWRMREHSLPGKTENEIWAELHYENIRNGGEWIETRLLAIGERTWPWFQECSAHVGKEGDMLSFDTDLIGPYGYCADLSRSWTIGLVPSRPTRRRSSIPSPIEQIMHNWEIIKPGMSFREFNEKSMRIPEEYHDRTAMAWRCTASACAMSIPRFRPMSIWTRARAMTACSSPACASVSKAAPDRRGGRDRQARDSGRRHRERHRSGSTLSRSRIGRKSLADGSRR